MCNYFYYNDKKYCDMSFIVLFMVLYGEYVIVLIVEIRWCYYLLVNKFCGENDKNLKFFYMIFCLF